MTRQVLFAGMTAVIALLSLLAGSGIGQAYQLYPITSMLVMGAFLLFPVGRTLNSGYVRQRELFLTLGLVMIIAVWPATQGYTRQGLQYGFLLVLPYVIGQFSFSERDIRAIGCGAGAVGFAVVAAALVLTIFNGWNRNDIAMVGFMGCAITCAAPWRTWFQKIVHKVYLVLMTLMVLALNSRSCVVGCLLLTVFAFGFVKPELFVKKPWLRRLVLLSPAIIAVGTVLFQSSQAFISLNAWSIEYFNKPLFNDRNILWERGLIKLREGYWLGDGYINNGYWHNCAITMLTGFGIVGYTAWLLYFENIMVDCRRWREDKTLILCIASFLTIMFQQSFELGLVSTTGSMMPYLILGMILGRMRHLREK